MPEDAPPPVATEPAKDAKQPDKKVLIYVIEVREEIASPVLYVVRNGVKDAEAAGADFVVLDMDTLGGSLGSMLEIMEILQKFDGETVTYVNDKAMSAGAFIAAATNRIYFAPKAVIGAAAPVNATGEDIEKTMQAKILSFLGARVRAISEGHRYRSEVVTAMMDLEYVFKIGDDVIKDKGSLLSLTANEAMKEYGDPPMPLLGSGIVKSLSELTTQLAAGAPFEVHEYQVTWSVRLFRWFNQVTLLLVGVGMLLLFIEFKTPGFGWIGGLGIALLVLVFLGNNVAGLSGHEPLVVFVLGVLLVLAEVFFFPGTMVPGMIGLIMILGSLVWGMTDIWPDQPIGFSSDMFLRPAANVFGGIAIAIVLGVVLVRFLPRGWIWDRMVLHGSVHGATGSPVSSSRGEASAKRDRSADPLIGAVGVTVGGLFPSGEVEVQHRRVQARVEVGSIPAGTNVRIVRRADFVYIVEPEAT